MTADIVSPTEVAEAWRGWYPQAASPSHAVAMMVDDRHRERIAKAADELESLRAENDDLHDNLIRVMKQRNVQTFAMQCFHNHAAKNGDEATAATIAEYLTAAGHPLKPQHWLLTQRYQ